MFVANLFENPVKNVIVVMPGGFHPFHQGHLALYNQARRAFPNAQVYVAATDYQEERPFPFAIKQRLAQEAGVPAHHFIQVSSPFAPKEITRHFNPETTALVFVRSTKDKNENPQPGAPGQIVTRGPRKGMAPYLQAYDGDPKPMSQHGYIAYLPTVEFKAGATGITSASEIRAIWPRASSKQKLQIVKDLYPNSKQPQVVVGLLDHAIIGETPTESTETQNPNTNLSKVFKQNAISKIKRALDNPNLSSADIQHLQQQLHNLNQIRESIESLNESFFFQGYQIDIDPATKELTVSHKGQVLHREKTSMVGRPGGAEMIKKRLSGIIDRLEDEKYPDDLEARYSTEKDPINLDRVSAMVPEDASGVIATKAQAKDPRYSMSLTKDVRPGQINKNLKAFKLK